MNTKNCVTSTKKIKKPIDTKYTSFVSIVIIHDQCLNRMKSYSPIALSYINETQTLIDLQISAIESMFNNFEIIITAGKYVDKMSKYIKQKYKNKNIRIVENTSFETTTNSESVRLSLNNINNDKIMIIDGNLCFKKDVFHDLNDMSRSFIISSKEKDESLDIGFNADSRTNNVEYFSYGATSTWSEIIFLTDPTIHELEKLLSTKTYSKKFLFEVINEVLKKQSVTPRYTDKNHVIKIKNIKTYTRARSNNEICSR